MNDIPYIKQKLIINTLLFSNQRLKISKKNNPLKEVITEKVVNKINIFIAYYCIKNKTFQNPILIR